MSQHKSQQYDFPKQPWECLILNINERWKDLEKFCRVVRSCLFEIYPHLLIFPPPSRKVKSRWNFPPESFLTVSWWPQNLKVLLLPNVRLFLRGAATRDYSDITICNHPTAPQRPILQLLSVRLLSKSLSWNHPLPLFPRMSPDRENCLLLFISNLIFVALSAATVVAQQAKEQLWLKG